MPLLQSEFVKIDSVFDCLLCSLHDQNSSHLCIHDAYRSREKAQSSNYVYPSLHEVPMDNNPAYAMPALTSVRNHGHFEDCIFADGQLGHHSSATNVDSLSEEREGYPDYEYVT